MTSTFQTNSWPNSRLDGGQAMSWKTRSRENLVAGQRCEEMSLYAPAVTRFYYAAYHAALEVLDQVGFDAPEVQDGAPYWNHREVARTLRDAVPGVQDLEARYELLRSRRVRADYRLNPVTATQCNTVHRTAQALVDSLWTHLDDEDPEGNPPSPAR